MSAYPAYRQENSTSHSCTETVISTVGWDNTVIVSLLTAKQMLLSLSLPKKHPMIPPLSRDRTCYFALQLTVPLQAYGGKSLINYAKSVPVRRLRVPSDCTPWRYRVYTAVCVAQSCDACARPGGYCAWTARVKCSPTHARHSLAPTHTMHLGRPSAVSLRSATHTRRAAASHRGFPTAPCRDAMVALRGTQSKSGQK